MTKEEVIALLNDDLSREYMHWHFYMQCAICVQGTHREELHEFFSNAAKGEMEHIQQFGTLLVGLGGFPTDMQSSYKDKFNPGNAKQFQPNKLLEVALRLEEEVVGNYVERIDQAVLLQENGGSDKIDGKWIELFLEEQILDSRADADHIREMLEVN